MLLGEDGPVTDGFLGDDDPMEYLCRMFGITSLYIGLDGIRWKFPRHGGGGTW